MRRATISARDGSPSRAGSVADISTPIEVALRIVRLFTGRSGSAARTMWNHDTARRTIEVENRPSAISTQAGLELQQRRGDVVEPHPPQREECEQHARDR